MAKEEKEILQWHPAFYAGIQIEFEEEADKLIFENEHQLGTKPKEIDVLIIKKLPNVKIQKTEDTKEVEQEKKTKEETKN